MLFQQACYNSGDDIAFQFYADGAMLFVNDKNLEHYAAPYRATDKNLRTYSVSGDSITMNLDAESTIKTDL